MYLLRNIPLCACVIAAVLIMMACGPVNRISKLQPIVTVSSSETEYLACFYAIHDVVWICQLLKDINLEHTRPTKVFIDNQSARQLTMNPVHYHHIDIKHYWIRDMVAYKAIELIHVPTTTQCEAFLAKTLPGNVFWHHVERSCVQQTLMVLTVKIRSALYI